MPPRRLCLGRESRFLGTRSCEPLGHVQIVELHHGSAGLIWPEKHSRGTFWVIRADESDVSICHKIPEHS